jgi:hypothetical protein
MVKRRLQQVQNLLARIVTATPRRRPTITSKELLIQLHWLPVKYQSQYKLAILAYRLLSSTASLYLSSLISRHQPPRSFRSSSDRFLLDVPHYKLSIASRGFRVAAPTI